MSESKYESKITSAPCSAAQVYRVLSNMQNLERVKDMIPKDKNLVLESVHPSPLSANRGGWFGQHQFSRCNEYLRQNGIEPIVW